MAHVHVYVMGVVSVEVGNEVGRRTAKLEVEQAMRRALGRQGTLLYAHACPAEDAQQMQHILETCPECRADWEPAGPDPF